MKIILCIFLLYITAVSVFGQSVELHGVVGKSIEFPAAVKIDGSLRYSGVPIGDVASSRFTAPHSEKFSGRVQWDSSTGLFSLSGLKMEDSGEYTVHNTQQNINTVFQLNVYKGNVPVSKPHLNVTRNEYRCTVLCAAARGTRVTLTLYREGEKNPYVTSPGHSHPDLNMTVPVESGTYTCEAENSVSRETSDPLTVGTHCTGSSAGTIAAIIIAVVAVAIVALIAVVFVFLYRRSKTEIRDEQVALQDAVKTSIQGSKSEWRDEQAALLEAVKTLIQDEQAALLEVVRRTIQEQLQAIPPDDTGSKSKEQLQAIPPDYTGGKSKDTGGKSKGKGFLWMLDPRQYLVRRTIQEEQAALQGEQLQAIPPDDEQAVLLEALKTSIQDEQAVLLEGNGSNPKELRGPAKGKNEPRREEGDPPPTER